MTGLSGHELRLSAGHALTSTPAASCGPTSCCSTGSPGVTQIDNAGPTSSETPRRPLSCAQCGDDPQAIVRAFKAGMQAAIFDTYAENLAASALKDELEQQWHGHVRRYGE